MKRAILSLCLSFVMLGAMPQDNPYIVKTKGVKKPVAKHSAGQSGGHQKDDEGPQDFMGKNFRYYSMCDWKDSMRFMVIPEKYDLLVNTFRSDSTGKEVSSGLLRHHIMVYKGYDELPTGRTRVNFHCETDGKDYYYELPYGSFHDYCYGKTGVPTLAYLGDVDKARKLLIGQPLLTRASVYRVDTEYDGDGYREVTVGKNKLVTVKKIGVGTRSFPVKIIVEDADGNEFYQCVAMSKTNSGLRDDEFIMDNEKFLFGGSFEYTGDKMAVSSNVSDYLGQTVHTKHPTKMSSKGSGKVREIDVPRFTGFIIDKIAPVKDSKYYTLTLRETESRRVFHKEVAFSEDDILSEREGKEEDFFGYLFGMGEGAVYEASQEIRTAIREGRVIIGMTESEVIRVMGNPVKEVTDADGSPHWMFTLTNDNILDVWFDAETNHVTKARPRMTSEEAARRATKKGKKVKR